MYRDCENCTVVYVANALFANDRHKTLANGTIAKRFLGETTGDQNWYENIRSRASYFSLTLSSKRPYDLRAWLGLLDTSINKVLFIWIFCSIIVLDGSYRLLLT